MDEANPGRALTTNAGPRPVLAQFAEDVEARLRANDHKGGWEGMSLYNLIEMAKTELFELEQAIERGLPPEEAIGEAADTAAFLMMIANQRAHGRGLDYCDQCRIVHVRYGEDFANCNHACHERRRLIRAVDQ